MRIDDKIPQFDECGVICVSEEFWNEKFKDPKVRTYILKMSDRTYTAIKTTDENGRPVCIVKREMK